MYIHVCVCVCACIYGGKKWFKYIILDKKIKYIILDQKPGGRTVAAMPGLSPYRSKP